MKIQDCFYSIHTETKKSKGLRCLNPFSWVFNRCKNSQTSETNGQTSESQETKLKFIGFHGTTLTGAENLVKNGASERYDSYNPEDLLGNGIYLAYYIEEAKGYAPVKPNQDGSGWSTGKILRVYYPNPEMLVENTDYYVDSHTNDKGRHEYIRLVLPHKVEELVFDRYQTTYWHPDGYTDRRKDSLLSIKGAENNEKLL